MYFEANPAEYAEWKLEKLGKKEYDKLKLAAHLFCKRDDKANEIFWKLKLKELEKKEIFDDNLETRGLTENEEVKAIVNQIKKNTKKAKKPNANLITGDFAPKQKRIKTGTEIGVSRKNVKNSK